MMEKQQLIDLESRIAFQEDTIQTLNDIVAQQQLQINQLEKTSKMLIDRILNLSTQINSQGGQVDEKPPHY